MTFNRSWYWVRVPQKKSAIRPSHIIGIRLIGEQVAVADVLEHRTAHLGVKTLNHGLHDHAFADVRRTRNRAVPFGKLLD